MARKLGLLTRWTDRLWSRRYRSILISDEEAAQDDRLIAGSISPLRSTELVRAIEQSAAAEREREGIEPLGVEQIQAQEPEMRPEALDRSPAPFIHAATRGARRMLYEAYTAFVALYREAADKLGKGDTSASFPPGSFPPHLPFVPV